MSKLTHKEFKKPSPAFSSIDYQTYYTRCKNTSKQLGNSDGARLIQHKLITYHELNFDEKMLALAYVQGDHNLYTERSSLIQDIKRYWELFYIDVVDDHRYVRQHPRSSKEAHAIKKSWEK